ncbi:MAG: hypothetical protein H6Q89_2824 [Myxococcaceae bacterium]|nr:hypothetical protein [Myxococcaceae bacterium]
MPAANRLPALLVPIALLVCGCPHRVDFGPEGQPTSAEALLKRVEVAETGVVSVKGDARLRVDSPQAKGVVTLFAAVTHPAFVHLESLDFFGKPQGVLISDGRTFGLYDGTAGKYFRGPATAQNVARFVPIALPPAELAALLLGRAPRLAHESAELRFDAEQGALVLTLKKGAATQVLTIQPPSYRVIRSTVTGLDAYDFEFENIEAVGGVTYPRRVVLTAKGSVRVELNYKDVVVNEPPDLTLYEMTPPANVPIVEVDEHGVPREGSKQ